MANSDIDPRVAMFVSAADAMEEGAALMKAANEAYRANAKEDALALMERATAVMNAAGAAMREQSLRFGEVDALLERCGVRRPREDWGRGYVYLVERTGTPLTKIGRSANPQRRLTQLQSEFRERLHLRASLAVRKMVAAETALHRHYRHRRHEGEWFILREADVERILARDFPDYMLQLL
jgi:hypothetical protein